MKRYKIDFNNGKVFEVTSPHETSFVVSGVRMHIAELISMGATITEIEEPRREYWIRYGSGESVIAYLSKHDSIPTIHVVELREGEIIVDANEYNGLKMLRDLKAKIGV